MSVKEFLKFTFEVIEEDKPHKTAAAFTFGRENLIPMMFNSIIEKIQKEFPKDDLELFKYYFDRHIELDEDEHGPMALKMIENLCGDDEQKWKEVEQVSKEALEKRLILWNGIELEIEHHVPA
jgi:pyrroloquinoline quinone (PQQ) biosynthesis protein C